MPSKKHDELIERVKEALLKDGFYIYRIDKRTIPDAVFSNSPIYAIEVQLERIDQKVEELKKSDFDFNFLIRPKKAMLEKIKELGVSMLKDSKTYSEIKEVVFRKYGKLLNSSTISTWKSKLE